MERKKGKPLGEKAITVEEDRAGESVTQGRRAITSIDAFDVEWGGY